MESLIKQTRARFGTRQESKEDSSSSSRKIPPQRSLSIREKKRSQSWIRRQFSRQMSWDQDFSSGDYPTAVAAAAYAIQSLEESKLNDQKENTYASEPRKSALKSSDEPSKKSFKEPDVKVPISTSTSEKMPERSAIPVPPVKKRISFAEPDETTRDKPERPVINKSRERAPPSFTDKRLDITDSKTPEPAVQKPDPPPARLPANQTADPRRQSSTKPETDPLAARLPATQIADPRRQSSTKPGPADSQADAWEKEEMASIKERYEKLRATIDNWENNKKKKAKRKMERTEAELDKRRVKAAKSYNSELARIESIAGGARAQAEENRRKEEIKVKEKANKIRSTGKLPATCLCF